MKWSAGIACAILSAACVPARAAGPLIAAINSADAIVIARSSPLAVTTPQTPLPLAIQQTLKGSLMAGPAVAYLAVADQRGYIFSKSSRCGIFLLARKGKRWQVIPQSTPQLQFEDFYFPSDACAAPGRTESQHPLIDS
jgi:hypothetical protein